MDSFGIGNMFFGKKYWASLIRELKSQNRALINEFIKKLDPSEKKRLRGELDEPSLSEKWRLMMEPPSETRWQKEAQKNNKLVGFIEGHFEDENNVKKNPEFFKSFKKYLKDRNERNAEMTGFVRDYLKDEKRR